MLFWKRRGEGGRGPATSRPSAPDAAETYVIEFDAMLKGNVAQRGRKKVRQFGVSVNGITKVVTSGELVDRDTYEALLEARAIQPMEPAANVRIEAPPAVSGAPAED